jgi:hypothetical protein
MREVIVAQVFLSVILFAVGLSISDKSIGKLGNAKVRKCIRWIRISPLRKIITNVFGKRYKR